MAKPELDYSILNKRRVPYAFKNQPAYDKSWVESGPTFFLQTIQKWPALTQKENTIFFNAGQQKQDPTKIWPEFVAPDKFLAAIPDEIRRQKFEYAFASSHSLREFLIRGNLAFAIWIARHHYEKYGDLDDKIQAGTEGLIKAVDVFDPNRGLAFTTYARPKIANHISRYLFRQSQGLPNNREYDENDQRLLDPPKLYKTEQVAIDNVLLAHVYSEIKKLPPEMADTVIRYFVYEQTQLEIANDLGLTKMGISKRLAKAIEGIRRNLTETTPITHPDATPPPAPEQSLPKESRKSEAVTIFEAFYARLTDFDDKTKTVFLAMHGITRGDIAGVLDTDANKIQSYNKSVFRDLKVHSMETAVVRLLYAGTFVPDDVLQEDSKQKVDSLSPQERNVLEKLIEPDRKNTSNTKLARELFISESTLKNPHLRNIFRKLGAKTRTHAAAIYLAAKLQQPV